MRHAGSGSTRCGRASTNEAALGSAGTAERLSRPPATTRRRMLSSSTGVLAGDTTPRSAMARVVCRRWPGRSPYDTTGQPRASASSTVTPPVECTSTSAAAKSVAHLLGEAEHDDPGFGGERRPQSCADLVAAAAQHDDGRRREPQRDPGGFLQITDAPTAPRDDHERTFRPAGRASGAPPWGPGVRRRRGPPAAGPAARCPGPPRRSVVAAHAGCITKCSSMPRSTQNSRPAEVGDGGVGRHRQPAGATQVAQDDRQAGVGRHDRGRPKGGDHLRETAAAEVGDDEPYRPSVAARGSGTVL